MCVYGTPPVRRYCVFTDWQHIRRRVPLGKNLTFQRAIKKVGDIEKKNINELDWDGARVRGMTFTSGRTNARAYSSRATSAYCRTLKAFSAQWRCQK